MFVIAGVIGLFVISSASAATFPKVSELPQSYASTTAYALSAGTAKQLVATSSAAAASPALPATTGRNALSVQAINCASGDVWLQFNDVVPTANTGFWLPASTTKVFANDIPQVYGSIRAISTGASCIVLVTEFRTQF